ncbi:hypothetical protein EJD97_025702 [Solanum chilense]|uniref:Uncharacterized protein n=1 Tax=Solanum chilense TaxID=4083 RepID=A0A6N2C339_SOLCI|nr:hypothetical protein EJD97_025702 [Solanum chilense]
MMDRFRWRWQRKTERFSYCLLVVSNGNGSSLIDVRLGGLRGCFRSGLLLLEKVPSGGWWKLAGKWVGKVEEMEFCWEVIYWLVFVEVLAGREEYCGLLFAEKMKRKIMWGLDSPENAPARVVVGKV